MFCTSCGQQIDPGMNFCSHCGKPVASAPVPPAEPEPQVAPEPAPESGNNNFHAADFGEKFYASGKHKSAPEPDIPQEEPTPGWQPPQEEPPLWTPPPFTPEPEPRRHRREASPTRTILIAGIAVAVALLIVIGAFLLVGTTDRRHIETVKNGYLGPYRDTTVQEFIYGFFGNGYDEATWAGESVGLLDRGVSLVLSSSEDPDRDPFEAHFVMGVDETFCLVSLNGETDPEDNATVLMSGLLAWHSEYQELSTQTPGLAILAGSSRDYAGDAEKLYQDFASLLSEEELSDEPFLFAGNEAEKPDSGTDTVIPEANENAGSVDATPAPGLQLATGIWYDVNTDYRSLQIDAIEGVENGYRYTLVNEETALSRYCYQGEVSSYDEATSSLSYAQTSMTQIVRAGAAGEKERPIRDGFTTSLTLSGDTLIWHDPEAGISISFSQAAKTIVPPAIQASFSTETPAIGGGNVRVVSAQASSTIDQQEVTNDPILMFDGDDTTSWQEGVDGHGIGETVSFSFDGVQQIDAISFKLGNWRNDRYFEGNAAPKTLKIIAGDFQTSVTFEHGRMKQWVTFSAPVFADSIQIVIEDVYPGTEYEDTCINEITVIGIGYE